MSDPVDHLKKLAKGLLKKSQAADPEACRRARQIYGDYKEVQDADLSQQLTLGRAQHVIAVEHGFTNWETVAASTPMAIRLAITMTRITDLNDFGIGLIDSDLAKPREVRAGILNAEREALRLSVERVGHVVDWLKEFVAPIEAMNPRRTSYGIKHVAEQDIGYLTNGVFIAAGIIAGYPYEIQSNSPNVRFGMSERSLNRISADRLKNRRPYAWRMPNWTDPGREPRELKNLFRKAGANTGVPPLMDR